MLIGKIWTTVMLAAVLFVATAGVAEGDSQGRPAPCPATVDITLSLDTTNNKVKVSDPAAHVIGGCAVEWVTDSSLSGASWCTWFLDDNDSAFPRGHKIHCKTRPDNVHACPRTKECPYTYVGLLLYNGQVYPIDPQIIVDPGGGEPGGKKKGKKK